LLSVAAIMIMTACASDGESSVPATTSSAASSAASSPGTSSTDDAPEVNAAEGRDLVLAWMNDTGPSEAEYDQLFDDEFDTEFRVTSEVGGALIVSIVINADSGQFTGLFFAPDIEFDTPTSTDSAIEPLRAMGTLRLLVADTADGSCAPIVDVNSNEVTPLGSVFKLYVLGAVVAAVGQGTISWDTPVVIDDALDSLPSGGT